MPNCKYDALKLCDARHINELETLAQIARTLSRETKQEEVLGEVIHMLEQRANWALPSAWFAIKSRT